MGAPQPTTSATVRPADAGGMRPHPVDKEAYRLADAKLALIEARLVELLEQRPSCSGMSTVVLRTDDPLSDFVRTYEASVFGAEEYDFHAGMKPYERQSLFLATVDLENRVVAHVKRIVEARKEPAAAEGVTLTGIEVIDDRLTATDDAERAGLRDILDFHKIAGIQKCINITSNMQTGRCKPSWEKPYSLVSYKAVFKCITVLGIDHLLAYMNRGAIRSLGRLGVEFERLAGREFHLPMPGDPGRYDLNYEAVCIPKDRHNVEAFIMENPDRPFTRLIAGLDVPLYWLDGHDASLSTSSAVTGAF
jgi:hypothetical protein